MDPVRLRALLPLPLDAVEAGFAERVTATHLFLHQSCIENDANQVDVDVGAAVAVEVVAAGTVVLRVVGVVAWRYRDPEVPAGREAGLGVLIGDVVDTDSLAVLARLLRLPGAGSRVRVPGQRVASRLRLGTDGVVAVPMSGPVPRWNTSPLPSLPTSRLVGLLADRALGDSHADGAVADSGIRDLDAAALREREAMLTHALRDLGGDTLDGDETAVLELSPPAEASTASGAVARPFASMLFEAAGFDAFPDAPSTNSEEPETRKPFEAQSTDVDMLGQLSAADVIAFAARRSSADEAAVSADDDSADDDSADDDSVDDGSAADDSVDDGDVVDDDLASLLSVEAELIDGGWEQDTPNGDDVDDGETRPTLRSRRSMPAPAPWPTLDVDEDPQIAGTAWSMSRRGQLGVESFGWPVVGSKRYSGQGDAVAHDDDDDADVFSAPPPPPSLDPFAAQVTDPRLNVEGLVARHVRANHNDIFADDDVGIDDLDPDATSDERPMPGPLRATSAPSAVRAAALRFEPSLHGDDDDRSASSSGEGNPV